jgi:hypothetical protein
MRPAVVCPLDGVVRRLVARRTHALADVQLSLVSNLSKAIHQIEHRHDLARGLG